jgi:hypothetical protein
MTPTPEQTEELTEAQRRCRDVPEEECRMRPNHCGNGPTPCKGWTPVKIGARA